MLASRTSQCKDSKIAALIGLNQRSNGQPSTGSLKKPEHSRKTSTSALLTTLKTLCGPKKLWKLLKKMGI